jgi:hypothetical protein
MRDGKLAILPFCVAQDCILLYRRFETGKRLDEPDVGMNSNDPQVANLPVQQLGELRYVCWLRLLLRLILLLIKWLRCNNFTIFP